MKAASVAWYASALVLGERHDGAGRGPTQAFAPLRLGVGRRALLGPIRYDGLAVTNRSVRAGRLVQVVGGTGGMGIPKTAKRSVGSRNT